MASEAQSISQSTKPPKRRIRNFLLDPRFQLKYTGMVVAVTVIVTGLVGYWLGSEAYNYSRENTALLMANAAGVSPELFAELERGSKEEDAKVLRKIVTGISVLVVALAIALGLTGIVVTHRVVGPAYKLKLLLGDVAAGGLNPKGGLRKGDELQALGDAFGSMVVALRDRREDELAQLEAAIAKARDAGVDDAALSDFDKLRSRLRMALDG